MRPAEDLRVEQRRGPAGRLGAGTGREKGAGRKLAAWTGARCRRRQDDRSKYTLLTESTRRVGTAWPAASPRARQPNASARSVKEFARFADSKCRIFRAKSASFRRVYNGSPQGADGSSRQGEHMVEIINPDGSGSTSPARGGQILVAAMGLGSSFNRWKNDAQLRGRYDFGAKTRWRRFWPQRPNHSSVIGTCSSTTAPSCVASAFPLPSRPFCSSSCWCSSAGPVTPPRGCSPRRARRSCSLSDATEARARKIEQRQALIEAILTGAEIDETAIAAAAAGGRGADAGPLGRVEQHPAGAGRADRPGARCALPDHRRRAAASSASRRRASKQSAARSRQPARPTRRSSSCSPAGRSSTTCRTARSPCRPTSRSRPRAFTSGYGVRSDPFRAAPRCTPGSTSPGPIGTPIYATADGTITDAGYNSGGYGNLVKIDHGRGIETRYGHLSAMIVRAGQRVTPRRSHRPHGLDRPLDRQPPSL